MYIHKTVRKFFSENPDLHHEIRILTHIIPQHGCELILALSERGVHIYADSEKGWQKLDPNLYEYFRMSAIHNGDICKDYSRDELEEIIAEIEADFYDPIIDFCNFQIEKANSKAENALEKSELKKVNRIYVSVFNDRFLIDQEGILYARCVQGDENLCMHTEAGNLFTVIGWDLDGNPCTISDTYSLFADRF